MVALVNALKSNSIVDVKAPATENSDHFTAEERSKRHGLHSLKFNEQTTIPDETPEGEEEANQEAVLTRRTTKPAQSEPNKSEKEAKMTDQEEAELPGINDETAQASKVESHVDEHSETRTVVTEITASPSSFSSRTSKVEPQIEEFEFSSDRKTAAIESGSRKGKRHNSKEPENVQSKSFSSSADDSLYALDTPTVKTRRHNTQEGKYAAPPQWPPLMPYNFAFEVRDDETTNYQNRVEVVEDGVLRGSFSFLGADGVIRTVTYTDDGTSGFQIQTQEIPTDVIVVGAHDYKIKGRYGNNLNRGENNAETIPTTGGEKQTSGTVTSSGVNRAPGYTGGSKSVSLSSSGRATSATTKSAGTTIPIPTLVTTHLSSKKTSDASKLSSGSSTSVVNNAGSKSISSSASSGLLLTSAEGKASTSEAEEEETSTTSATQIQKVASSTGFSSSISDETALASAVQAKNVFSGSKESKVTVASSGSSGSLITKSSSDISLTSDHAKDGVSKSKKQETFTVIDKIRQKELSSENDERTSDGEQFSVELKKSEKAEENQARNKNEDESKESNNNSGSPVTIILGSHSLSGSGLIEAIRKSQSLSPGKESQASTHNLDAINPNTPITVVFGNNQASVQQSQQSLEGSLSSQQGSSIAIGSSNVEISNSDSGASSAATEASHSSSTLAVGHEKAGLSSVASSQTTKASSSNSGIQSTISGTASSSSATVAATGSRTVATSTGGQSLTSDTSFPHTSIFRIPIFQTTSTTGPESAGPHFFASSLASNVASLTSLDRVPSTASQIKSISGEPKSSGKSFTSSTKSKIIKLESSGSSKSANSASTSVLKASAAQKGSSSSSPASAKSTAANGISSINVFSVAPSGVITLQPVAFISEEIGKSSIQLDGSTSTVSTSASTDSSLDVGSTAATLSEAISAAATSKGTELSSGNSKSTTAFVSGSEKIGSDTSSTTSGSSSDISGSDTTEQKSVSENSSLIKSVSSSLATFLGGAPPSKPIVIFPVKDTPAAEPFVILPAIGGSIGKGIGGSSADIPAGPIQSFDSSISGTISATSTVNEESDGSAVQIIPAQSIKSVSEGTGTLSSGSSVNIISQASSTPVEASTSQKSSDASTLAEFLSQPNSGLQKAPVFGLQPSPFDGGNTISSSNAGGSQQLSDFSAGVGGRFGFGNNFNSFSHAVPFFGNQFQVLNRPEFDTTAFNGNAQQFSSVGASNQNGFSVFRANPGILSVERPAGFEDTRFGFHQNFDQLIGSPDSFGLASSGNPNPFLSPSHGGNHFGDASISAASSVSNSGFRPSIFLGDHSFSSNLRPNFPASVAFGKTFPSTGRFARGSSAQKTEV
ncbi:Cuticle Protein CPR RR-2 [Hyalella azteca]|nr:Cuticle Protein CPR RR-2 [Hyalella azteca]